MGVEVMALFSKLLEMENSCWTDFSHCFFLCGRQEEKKLQDEVDFIEGAGLASSALAGWLTG